MKAPINRQALRRKIYPKAKSEKTWRRARKLRGFDWSRWSRQPSFMKPWVYIIMSTGCGITRLESAARLIGRISLWVKLTGRGRAGNSIAVL